MPRSITPMRDERGPCWPPSPVVDVVLIEEPGEW